MPLLIQSLVYIVSKAPFVSKVPHTSKFRQES